MKNKYTYEEIEAYLLNQLSTSDRQDFEIELLVNDELQQALQEQEVEHMAMEVLLENRLRKKLKVWQAAADYEEEIETTRQPKAFDKQPSVDRINHISKIVATISLFLFLGVGVLYFMYDRSHVNEDDFSSLTLLSDGESKALIELAATYSDPINIYEITTDIRANKKIVEIAKSKLKAKKYDEAINSLMTILKEEPNNLNIQYLLGLAHYKQKKFAKAIHYFEAVATNTFEYNTQVEWYLSLAHLDTQIEWCLMLSHLGLVQKQKTIASLQEISLDKGHKYYEKAINLLTLVQNIQLI